MSGKAVGRAAVDLPWLCPNTNSLVRLAEDPASLAPLSSADPALFVFLIRFALGDACSPFIPPSQHLLSAALPDMAAAHLAATPHGWLDAANPAVQRVREVAAHSAFLARKLAEQTQWVFPEAAETAARLAPLGWYAALASDTAADACLNDPTFQSDPAACQRRHWELDHDAIAGRLAGRWKFPAWLASIVGCLNLPFEAAVHCGADADLFAIVALAVHQAERTGANLGLTQHMDRPRILAHLGLDAHSRAALNSAEWVPVQQTDLPPAANPHRTPLVANLLRSAANARRRHGAALVVRLEERIDALQHSAASLAELAGNRLRDAKLAALAEFAAGAGHEINNPLAVISGNAQRLLRTEQDDDRADSLRSIVRQSQRISGILRELMDFARPPQAQSDSILVLNLVNGICADLLPLAEERGVRFELVNAAAEARLHADSRQIRTALTAVIRNAIEAAGFGGWVRLHCSYDNQNVRFTIEDSGPGLTGEAAEHAFDPFYSGRIAGRGRGLGLSTAWQFARRNGGDLGHDASEGPTRFILTIPLAAAWVPLADRRSA